MALSNTTVKTTYQGDGSTTTFAITPALIEGTAAVEIDVYLRDETTAAAITQTLQTDPTEYSVSGSNVVMVTAPTATQKLVIVRVLTLTHDLDLEENAAVPMESIEDKFNRMTALIQQMQEQLDRVPRLRITEQFGSPEMGQPFNGYVVGVNSAVDGFEFIAPTTIAANAVGGVTAVATASIANNNAVAADVTGLVVSETSYTSAIAFVEIERGTNFSNGVLYLQYQNSTWRVQEGLFNGEVHGLTFTITAAGQVQYTSDNSSAGTLKHSMLRFTA